MRVNVGGAMFFVTFWPFLEILQFLMCHLTNAHDKISSKLIILKYVNICTQSFLCCMQCAFVVSKGSQRQRNSSGLSIWWHQRCFPVEWMDLDKAFYEQKKFEKRRQQKDKWVSIGFLVKKYQVDTVGVQDQYHWLISLNKCTSIVIKSTGKWSMETFGQEEYISID